MCVCMVCRVVVRVAPSNTIPSTLPFTPLTASVASSLLDGCRPPSSPSPLCFFSAHGPDPLSPPLPCPRADCPRRADTSASRPFIAQHAQVVLSTRGQRHTPSLPLSPSGLSTVSFVSVIPCIVSFLSFLHLLASSPKAERVSTHSRSSASSSSAVSSSFSSSLSSLLFPCIRTTTPWRPRKRTWTGTPTTTAVAVGLQRPKARMAKSLREWQLCNCVCMCGCGPTTTMPCSKTSAPPKMSVVDFGPQRPANGWRRRQ